MNNTQKLQRFDSILKVPYLLGDCLATELSDAIKKCISLSGMNPDKYNTYLTQKHHFDGSEHTAIYNPPKEIYEYQNFFVMDMGADGSSKSQYILLDGFRRLLWYKVPVDVTVTYRIYKRADLSDKQLLQLLISLNHTKFFSGIGEFFDRGFALALKMCFDLDILKYEKTFDGYLNGQKVEKEYSFGDKHGQEHADIVFKRMLSDKFISDMRFVQALVKKDIMLNSNFGALLYRVRHQNPEAIFDPAVFLQHNKANKFLPELYQKYIKNGDGRSSESEKAINRILEIYDNIFKLMLGKSVAESYLEAKDRTKALSEKIKKDKKGGWVNLSKRNGGNQSRFAFQVKDAILANGNKSPKIKIVIHPDTSDYSVKSDKSKSTSKAGLVEDFYIGKVDEYDGYNSRVLLKIQSNELYVGNGYNNIRDKKAHDHWARNIDVFVSLTEFTDKKTQYELHNKK